MKDRIVGFIMGIALLALAAAIWMHPEHLDTFVSAHVSGRGGNKVKFFLALIWNRPVGTIGGVFGLLMLWSAFSRKEDEKIKEKIEEKEKKAIKEETPLDVVPVLKPIEWGAKVAPGGTIVRPFWEKSLDEEKFLVIGYGVDKGTVVHFITEKELPEGMKGEKLHEQALKNLERELQRDCSWQKMGTGGHMTVALYSGHYNSAEAILSPSIMHEAHRMLGTDQLLVGIATRGALMAIDARVDKEVSYSFSAATIKRFYTGEEAPISSKIWIVVKGKVEGYVGGLEDLEEKIAAENSKGANAEEEKVSVNAFTASEEDGNTVYLTIFTEEKDLLIKTLRNAAIQTA